MENYDIYETDEYIQVSPKGWIVDARKCRTFYKREGWTMTNVKQFYGEE